MPNWRAAIADRPWCSSFAGCASRSPPSSGIRYSLRDSLVFGGDLNGFMSRFLHNHTGARPAAVAPDAGAQPGHLPVRVMPARTTEKQCQDAVPGRFQPEWGQREPQSFVAAGGLSQDRNLCDLALSTASEASQRHRRPASSATVRGHCRILSEPHGHVRANSRFKRPSPDAGSWRLTPRASQSHLSCDGPRQTEISSAKKDPRMNREAVMSPGLTKYSLLITICFKIVNQNATAE